MRVYTHTHIYIYHFVIYYQVIKYLITSLIFTLILINTQRIGIKDRVLNKVKWMNSLDHTLLHVELYTISISFLAREALVVILSKMFLVLLRVHLNFPFLFPPFFCPSSLHLSVSLSLCPFIPSLHHPSISLFLCFSPSVPQHKLH